MPRRPLQSSTVSKARGRTRRRAGRIQQRCTRFFMLSTEETGKNRGLSRPQQVILVHYGEETNAGPLTQSRHPSGAVPEPKNRRTKPPRIRIIYARCALLNGELDKYTGWSPSESCRFTLWRHEPPLSFRSRYKCKKRSQMRWSTI